MGRKTLTQSNNQPFFHLPTRHPRAVSPFTLYDSHALQKLIVFSNAMVCNCLSVSPNGSSIMDTAKCANFNTCSA